MNLFKRLYFLYKEIFWSLEKQAKYLGVKMGSNNLIASKFWSSEPYLITIGSNCQITSGVRFFTHGGAQVLRDKDPDFDLFGKIEIGNYVYIGNNTLIMPGVCIGSNVLIAAGSVVTKSIPSNYVVGGNPARYICSIEEYKSKNLKYNLNSKSMSYDDKKSFLLSLPDNMFIIKNSLNSF